MVAPASPRAASLGARVEALLSHQRDRWLLWLPVGVIAGSAAYLTAPSEPDWRSGPMLFAGACLLSCLIAFWPRAGGFSAIEALRRALAALLALAAAAGLGLCAAQTKAALISAPILESGDEPIGLDGWVMAVEPGERGPRLRLLVQSIEGVEAPPRVVRVAVSGHGVLTPGRGAHCFGLLSPPSGPVAPGAYDYARRAFYEQLGATGFAYGRCRPRDLGAPARFVDRANLKIAAWRADLAAAMIEATPGRGGAIGAALVTGDQGSVDRETHESLRNSGLGHLLSVSGVHMAVVGGMVFSAASLFFALIPPIALRFPVKKIAAAAALLSLTMYLVVSGSSVPAIRAYIMAAVAFGAILLDRPAISMRGLALSALIVVLLFPESVVEPGFQMSFAATLALVALFEAWKRDASEPKLPHPGPIIAGMYAITNGIGGVIGVSLVAGLATDPFALFHFQRFSIYALASNLAVAPIMSFLVAPAAGIAALLAPFDAAQIPLNVMAWALDLVAAIGEAFGSRPEAVRALPKPPHIAFLLCVAALLWACLWRGWLRLGGLAFFAATIVLYIAAPKPDIAFDADLRAVFLRTQADDFSLISGGQRSTFARDRVGQMLGLTEAQAERLAPPQDCNEARCFWRGREGERFALVYQPSAFAEACGRAALILTRLEAPASCPHVLDAKTLTREGGGFVYFQQGVLRIERALTANTNRPWHRTPAQIVRSEPQE